MKDGVSRQTGVKIVITETKKKDRLRFDYVYGEKGTPDFSRGTRFLKLDPAKAEFDLQWKRDSKEIYKATGLDEFAKSGFGKFAGSMENASASEQDRIFRVVFELTKDTLSYEWQNGPDESHLAFRSLFTLNRSAVIDQP